MLFNLHGGIVDLVTVRRELTRCLFEINKCGAMPLVHDKAALGVAVAGALLKVLPSIHSTSTVAPAPIAFPPISGKSTTADMKAYTLGDSERTGVAKGGNKSTTESGESITSKRKMSVSNDAVAVDGAKEEDGNSAKKQKLGPEEVIVIDDSDDDDAPDDDDEVEYMGVKKAAKWRAPTTSNHTQKTLLGMWK